jgi:hypothetical protein
LSEPSRSACPERSRGDPYSSDDSDPHDSPYDTGTYPRIQILTVEELLNGAQVEYPRLLDATFKQAPKARGAAIEQLKLDSR